MSEMDSAAVIEDWALRMLASREHSRFELARKLSAKGSEPDMVDAVLDRLVETGALNEARFAEAYVSERVRKGFGPLRIRAELQAKGLSDALIEAHLSQEEGWEVRLATLHDRRFGRAAPGDRAEYARRGRYLEQRGFPAEMIRRQLHRPD